ncbi:CLUMA_CG013350, isoform A [Clunio marinus]|uniref:CLUMA_CG013350, isoform A n=1 Tax=Clunio marinus TaxID=568069 RepID=A0A1J1IIP4_9DIPT|nr:CLUMA_CG013350, isoform A [Clunio marinus]
MLYVVLPSELSRKAVTTLVQYMYTGETTVANEILNEVLRGGEILKIRGLCKVPPGNNNEMQRNTKLINDATPNSQCHSLKISNEVNELPLKNVEHTSRNSAECTKSTSVGANSRSSSTKNSQHDFPFVVMTPQTHPSQLFPQQQQSSSETNPQQSPSSTTIILKKDMAIDPGETNIPIEHYGLISLKIAAAVKKAQQQQCLENVKTSPSNAATRSCSKDSVSASSPFQTYSTSERSKESFHMSDISPYNEQRKLSVENQKQSVTCLLEIAKNNKISFQENNQCYISPTLEKDINQQFTEGSSFHLIKKEPEWCENQNEATEKIAENFSDFTNAIKPEALDSLEDSLQSEVGNTKVYSPLVCEECNMKFQVPAEWVRHIETHYETAAQSNIPKKRKRPNEQEENTENINILSCDLCEDIHLATPADWVRHVQNTHTETELALSNNSILTKTSNVGQSKDVSVEKMCNVCDKVLPSYASMLIHKRTHHVGKSFVCSQFNCKKEFNVKSNLLRHMRSCHNQVSSNESHDSDSVD